MKTKTSKNGGAGTPTHAFDDSEPVPQNGTQLVPAPLQLKKVLVPIDFTDCSLHSLGFALSLAEQFQAQIVLLNVVEATMHPGGHAGLSAAFDEANQNLVAAARERLENLVRRYATAKPIEVLVRIGHAHSEITDTANALGSDLIIIATHGYTGLKHALLGSTAENVIRYASCPVLTLRAPALP
jgi:universal stress protein A